MTPSQLYKFYKLNIEAVDDRGQKLDPVHFRPIIEDIIANDPHTLDQLLRLLRVYSRELAVRVMDERQTEISFDTADDEEA